MSDATSAAPAASELAERLRQIRGRVEEFRGRL